jgi:DNA-binding NtrC family response regulator
MSESIPPIHCLIVEDDSLLAGSFQMVLEDGGAASVDTAESETEALRLIMEERPDVALLDLDIVGGSSLGIATTLLAKDVPVAFVSGHSPEDVPWPFEGLTFIQKPIGRDDLLNIVRQLAAS